MSQTQDLEGLEERDPVISHRILVKNDAKLAKATGKCGEPLQTSAKQCFAMVCIHLDAFRTSSQHFPMIFHGFPRFWEPSPAELPSKLQRVSEPTRSMDLEDFNRISMNFPKI